MGWKLTCRDAGDGSGDIVVDLPDDLLQAAGWNVGDTLELEQDPNDSTAIRLSVVVKCDMCDASTVEEGYGVLQALWRDGEAESMRLCKSCNVQILYILAGIHCRYYRCGSFAALFLPEVSDAKHSK